MRALPLSSGSVVSVQEQGLKQGNSEGNRKSQASGFGGNFSATPKPTGQPVYPKGDHEVGSVFLIKVFFKLWSNQSLADLLSSKTPPG